MCYTMFEVKKREDWYIMINKNYNKNIKKERLEMALFIASECGEEYIFENEKE